MHFICVSFQKKSCQQKNKGAMPIYISRYSSKIPKWPIIVLFPLFSLVYVYLYSNVGVKTSGVYNVFKSDFQRVLKNDLSPFSSYLNFINVDKSSTRTSFTSGSNTSKGISNNFKSLRRNILRNDSQALLTLFTSWNDNSDKYFVHNLTTSNWMSLRPYVIPVVFTNDTGLEEECRNQGWNVFPIREVAAGGVPVLKHMFMDAMDAYNTTFYAYSNSDILFTKTLIDTLSSLSNSLANEEIPVLIVGRRTNVEIGYLNETDGSSWDNLTSVSKASGNIFSSNAEDFFITSGVYPWDECANVVIGRPAYDNWLVYNARKRKHIVIDATGTLLAIHQTTSAGNMEGHSHSNKGYNHNLLRKTYRNIKHYYFAGTTDCAEYYTRYEQGAVVTVTRNTRRKRCLSI